MRNLRILITIILNFLMLCLSFGEVYIHKNNEEKLVLEKIRNKEIIVGLYCHEFYNQKSLINNISINDIFIDLFNNYLDLNVTFKNGCFPELLADIKNNNIDCISLLNEHESRKDILSFSNGLFNEAIYVTSSKKSIKFFSDLEDENIYVISGDIYKEYLKNVLFINNIQANIIEVDSFDEYKNELLLTSNPIMYNSISTIKISNSSDTNIGISHEFKDLVPILNRALELKYKKIINTQISYIKKQMSLDNFSSSLSKEESTYLKGIRNITVHYNKELESNLYYTSKIDKKIKGIIPNLLRNLEDLLNIKINMKELSSTSVDKDSIELYISSETKKRSEKLVFTDILYRTPIYSIQLKDSNSNNTSIGVISNSLEEEIIRKYNLYDNLKFFQTYNLLLEALNRGDVQKILTKNISLLDINSYNISLFEELPISLAFQKDDIILRNIINKAIFKLVSLDKIIDFSLLEKSNEELLFFNKINSKRKVANLLSIGLLSLLILALFKIKTDKKYQAQLLKDPLSQLPNRIVFNDFCKNKGNSSNGYAIIIDLDNFKDINDTYGHEVGDLVISEFSSYIRLHFDSKTFFRISGDEFYGVVDRNLDDIISIMKNYNILCPLMKRYEIIFSVGIRKKTSNSCIKTSFRYADIAMLEAKKTNGFSYKVADAEFIEVKEKEEKILAILNDSLDEIYPVFQPKIDLNTNIVIGVEALARCQSKEFGIIYPLEFIGIAETYNLVHKIDFKIAEESIKLIKERVYNENLYKDFRVSFNISVNTFKRKDLVETIVYLLTKYNVSGKHIEIEVTESVLVTDMKDIIDKLNKLIKLGIQISLDDFTAGHSTAGLLPLLPLGIVKFDKSLLDSINQSEERAKIVYLNLISLVKDLNIKIVAEGIETSEELEFLRSAGVDYGQGYLMGKPTPYDDIINL